MEVDILIDKLTDCLVERSTGEQVETEYCLRTVSIKPKDYKNWKFGRVLQTCFKCCRDCRQAISNF